MAFATLSKITPGLDGKARRPDSHTCDLGQRRRALTGWTCAARLPAAVELQRAQDAPSLLSVVERRSSELRLVHLSGALWRVAKGALQENFESRCDETEGLVHQCAVRISETGDLITETQHGRLLASVLRSVVVLRRRGILASSGYSVSVINDAFERLGPSASLPAGDQTTIAWALDASNYFVDRLPLKSMQDISSYCSKQYPFSVLPNSMKWAREESEELLGQLCEEVAFKREIITLVDGQNGQTKQIEESRMTAWEAASPMITFQYSGKSMEPNSFSPVVQKIRSHVIGLTGVAYDGVLLNFYPHGKSGMRFHSDPDQGTKWATDTAVVSVGSPRQFCFRAVDDFQERHDFTVFSGDVVWMKDDCQERYQHAVKVENAAIDAGPRVSLVFKKLL